MMRIRTGKITGKIKIFVSSVQSEQLGMALPTLQKTIGVLRDKGLVSQRGKARETTYSLNLSQE